MLVLGLLLLLHTLLPPIAVCAVGVLVCVSCDANLLLWCCLTQIDYVDQVQKQYMGLLWRCSLQILQLYLAHA